MQANSLNGKSFSYFCSRVIKNTSAMPLFRTEKPKQFTFIPRFYDERKEELKNRIEAIEKENQPTGPGGYVPHIKGQMRARHDLLYGQSAKPRKKLISQRLVTLVYIGLVLVIIYYIIRMLAMAK